MKMAQWNEAEHPRDEKENLQKKVEIYLILITANIKFKQGLIFCILQ